MTPKSTHAAVISINKPATCPLLHVHALCCSKGLYQYLRCWCVFCGMCIWPAVVGASSIDVIQPIHQVSYSEAVAIQTMTIQPFRAASQCKSARQALCVLPQECSDLCSCFCSSCPTTYKPHDDTHSAKQQ